MKKEKISLAQTRRVALAAQGFGEPRPSGPVNRGHLSRMLNRIGLLQIDSVSAVVRAHYMPAFSRLGPYPMSLLDEATGPSKRRLFEYWAHEASFLPLEIWPLMQWRMERARDYSEIYAGLAKWARQNQSFIEEIFDEVKARAPIAASQFDGHKSKGGWWGWSDTKAALEWLFWAGRITAHSRRGFERLYDLPERVLPKETLEAPVPDAAEAHRQLLRISARALGVGTAQCLRDYFRLSPADISGRIEELVEEGDLLPVKIEGWHRPGYLWKDARLPRKINTQALLAPFDPLVFERTRTEKLFDFHYRIEIYTPAEKRRFGYYVMPFLLDEALVARVDLRADRPNSVLRVLAAYSEPSAPPQTAERLLEELRLMQNWLSLETLDVTPAGDLGPELHKLALSIAGT
ncbi:MAG: YcaQ family DNA glycosylase [Rhizobiaceae bacterium]|nr:YcaQ family DNA glycosylase [Rhizobiaceae bacterium]